MVVITYSFKAFFVLKKLFWKFFLISIRSTYRNIWEYVAIRTTDWNFKKN